jgi:putative hydrolase of the HAD superfamily
MARIDFIYFDLGNVLLNFSHQRACEQIASLAGITAGQVRKIAFDTSLVHDYETGLISDQEFFEGFCIATGVEVARKRFFQAFNDIFHLNQSIIPLVVELNYLNFPKGILSNTCLSHWQFAIREFPLLADYFSVNVLSFEARSAKPDLGIYTTAILAANTSPNRIFFVDDRPENVAGAIAAGMDAVMFESTTQLRNQLFQRGLNI